MAEINRERTATTGRTVDPVCGMQVSTEDAAYSVEYEGRAYYFCSESCARRFREDPESYVTREQMGASGEFHARPSAIGSERVRHDETDADTHSAPELAEPDLEVQRAIQLLPSVTTGISLDARRVRVDLPIEGLDCAVCVQNVKKALQAVPGVERAVVNPRTHVATVAYDRTRAGLAEMYRAVRDAGYQVGLATARIGIEGIF